MLLLILSLFTFSLQLQEALAQSDASCLPFYSWTFNSQHKSPCEVASSLLSVCNNGPFFVHALPDNSHYLGPTTVAGANPCQCNTVLYSLMSACGACQGKSYLSWSVWSANCPTTYTSYPSSLPQGVAVPGWAYLDVTANDNFDQTTARANSNATESTLIVPTPTPAPTSSTSSSNLTVKSNSRTGSRTKTSTSASLTSSLLPSSTPAPAQTSQSSATSDTAAREAHANLIGGVVVGCVAAVILVIGIAAYVMRRRRFIARNGQILPSPSSSDSQIDNSTWQNQQGPYMQQTNSTPRISAPSLNSSMHAPAIIVDAPRVSNAHSGHGADAEMGPTAH
ncbi:hypothetical protein BJ165DRAFT_1400515 [Panaeolus papilionaceus]|nr:hypothetical protein BJ165DRAFT_1400515 [Panaeolus papilionaceus]